MSTKLLKYALLIFCVSVFIAPAGEAQNSSSEVFAPKIPQKQPKGEERSEQISIPVAGEPQVSEPVDISVNLEGFIWGTVSPKAIIDGEIYSEGDRIMIETDDKEAPYSDAVIRKIDKLGIHVEYAGRMYTLEINEKEDSRRRRRKRR